MFVFDTKMEQHGQAKKHPRATCSNLFEWHIDFPFLLGLCLATCFNTPQRRGHKLFPGGSKSQAKQVDNFLVKALKENKAKVLAVCCNDLSELCLHSLRKDFSTCLVSLPGGPLPAALCLRAGCSMGQVKDTCFHQTQGGDEFSGRRALLLNVTNGEFASSPPFFEDNVDGASVSLLVKLVFPQFVNTDGFDMILMSCFVALDFHRDKVMAPPTNHTARSIPVFANLKLMDSVKNKVIIVKSWEIVRIITGVPPHVKQMVDLANLATEQATTINLTRMKVVDSVTTFTEQRRIGGGELAEVRTNKMMSSCVAREVGKLTTLMNGLTGATEMNAARPSAAANWQFAMGLNGQGRFPSAGLRDMWMQWNLGNREHSVPLLRLLNAKDFTDIDEQDKTANVVRFQRGKKRRGNPAGKHV